jgi:hypothetical protein
MTASRAQRTATSIAVVLLFAVGFVPLFGGPGYEAALAAGLVLPALAALATAFDVVRSDTDASRALERGAASGAWLASVGLAVCLVHGVRDGFCDAAEGTELFLLGPCAGSVMGGSGEASPGWSRARLREDGERSRQAAGSWSSPSPSRSIAGIGQRRSLLYSPMVFAFDPFVGCSHPCTTPHHRRLVTYRMGSLPPGGRLCGRPCFVGRRRNLLAVRKRPGVAVLASRPPSQRHTLAEGAKMGHQTEATIREALGQRLPRALRLVYPTGTRRSRPSLGARVRRAPRPARPVLRGEGPAHVVAVFASADQRLRWGAGRIAKPWRREIIQRAGFRNRDAP